MPRADGIGAAVCVAGVAGAAGAAGFVSAGGFATTGSDGYRARGREFEATGVEALLIGSGLRLVRIGLPSAAEVRVSSIVGAAAEEGREGGANLGDDEHLAEAPAASCPSDVFREPCPRGLQRR